MSVCQTGTEEDSGSEEVTTVAVSTGIRDIYKQKPASKVVRVLTVLAYLLSVSLAAILLSVYYVCVWKSPVLPKAEDDTAALQALVADNKTDLHHYHFNSTSDYNYTGGSDSTINGLVESPDGSSTSSDVSEPSSSESDTTTEPYDFTDDYVTDDPRTVQDNDNVT